VAALLLLAAAGARAASVGAIDVGAVDVGAFDSGLARAIERCAAALSETGLADTPPARAARERFDLETRCPGLSRALDARPGLRAHTGMVGARASVAQVRDLRALAAGFARARAGGAAPEPRGLDALVAEVLLEEQPELGWWEVFQRWFESRFGEAGSLEVPWLRDWVEALRVPAGWGEYFFSGVIALVVALALIVVVNELRHLDYRRGRRGRGGPRRRAQARAADTPPDLDAIESLPAARRPAALLALVVRALAERGLVPETRHRTNRELVAAVRARDPALAGALGTFVRGVEPIVYGAVAAEPERVRGLGAGARALLERVRGLPA